MPITQNQLNRAKLVQDGAVQDMTPTIRLVAGPGTGKSFVIEGRVLWLMASKNIPAKSIIAISFTRAAANDLKDRIYNHCLKHGQIDVTDVRVSTLHSLALHILGKTGNLKLYPVKPVIMDDWELSNIFDAEFAEDISITPTRGSEIRRDHEAYWSTGNWNPPNAPAISVPITDTERQSFIGFYTPFVHTYASILPGELIRMCVTNIQTGLIDPVTILGVDHLVIDEVQDLNPCDFEFIDSLISNGVNIFISGDDDQSVYSFRYAFPFGIQNFTTKYSSSTNHVLNDCFRCTPLILNAAIQLITTYPSENRIAKNLTSVYSSSTPVNNGFIQANNFPNSVQEARFIAKSCKELISLGIQPNEIMILISNRNALLDVIIEALDFVGVDFDVNQKDEFKDSSLGRFLQAILRITEDNDDYIAYRTLLGTPSGIGLRTCNSIRKKVISNNLNYKNLFYNLLPVGIFTKREISAIDKSKQTIIAIHSWDLHDTISDRLDEIDSIFSNNFSQSDVQKLSSYIQSLPQSIELGELLDFLRTNSQEEKDNLIDKINKRTNPTPNTLNATQSNNKVRIMTFHSSKGLSAKVVFIPGLEEDVFPNTSAQRIPGLVFENARLLYVAITRAKAACILSFAKSRKIFGKNTWMNPSRFCSALGTTFNPQNNSSLTPSDLQTIKDSIANL